MKLSSFNRAHIEYLISRREQISELTVLGKQFGAQNTLTVMSKGGSGLKLKLEEAKRMDFTIDPAKLHRLNVVAADFMDRQLWQASWTRYAKEYYDKAIKDKVYTREQAIVDLYKHVVDKIRFGQPIESKALANEFIYRSIN